jgi:branched-chain amino acid transport system substrate-binding protein
MSWRKRAVCRIGAVAVAGVLLAACSSGGGSSSGTGSSSGGGGGATASGSSAAGPKLNGSPITLGMIMNTNYLPFAPPGAQAAVAAINAAGGVKGHPLKLDVCDNQQNANAAAACARQFVNDSSVIATVGDNNSFGSEANPPLTSAKIVGIGTNPLGSGDYASPRIFALANGGLEFIAGAQFMFRNLNASHMGMVVVGSPTSEALPALVNQLVLQPAGSKLAGVATIPPTATDVSSPAASLTNTNGQLLAITQAVTESYITASRQQGYKGPFIMSETLADAQQLAKDMSGSDLDQLYGMSYFDKESPGYAHFLADMRKYQPAVHPGDLSAIAWLGVETFAKVAATLPAITRQAVWDAMNKQSALSTDGMTPVLNYTEPGKALGGTAPRVIAGLQSIYIDRYQDGQWKPYFTPQKPVPLFPAP